MGINNLYTLYTDFRILSPRMTYLIYPLPFFWHNSKQKHKINTVASAPSQFVFNLSYKNNKTVQKTTLPKHFTGLPKLHLILLDTKKIHLILGIFGRSTKLIQMLACFQHVMEIYLERWSTQCKYVGHLKSKASLFIPFSHCHGLSHLIQGMVLDQRL